MDWMPWVRPAAMRPRGSGPRQVFSCVRTGERLMFRPGPTLTRVHVLRPQRLTHLAGQAGVPRTRARGPSGSRWLFRSRRRGGHVAELVAYAVGPPLMMKEGTCCGMAQSSALAPERRAAACRRVRSLAFVSAVAIVVSCLCSIAWVSSLVPGRGYGGVALPIECVVCCFLGLLWGVAGGGWATMAL